MLSAELVKQYITGLQYDPDVPGYIEAAATCKHFDAHNGPEKGRGGFDAVVSYRDWIETFQPAFKACTEAGVRSYMCSYNAINGVPACANPELLIDVARSEWNFTGWVVSDCGAVPGMWNNHHYARTKVQ